MSVSDHGSSAVYPWSRIHRQAMPMLDGAGLFVQVRTQTLNLGNQATIVVVRYSWTLHVG